MSKISIVIPAKNEAACIVKVIDLCRQALAKQSIPGEIIIVDSSTDETANLARSKGAKVISAEPLGIGFAYKTAIPHVTGNYVVFGDADCTYDFSNIKPFIEQLDKGYDFVIGSRITGKIEPGAMPWLHRYFGNPITTKLYNFVFKKNLSDIHCGLRALTLAALKQINLQANSWDYAVEMVIKAAKMNLKLTEIPISYTKSLPGRQSHLCKNWFTPWLAGLLTVQRILKNLK